MKTDHGTMELFTALFLLGIPSGVAPVRHSLKYLSTSSSEVPNLPEFLAAFLLDGVQIIHYDSNTTRAVPKQDWMSNMTDEWPTFWEKQTEVMKLNQQTGRANLQLGKQHFNQTGGLHVLQVMSGCEWDDQTDQVYGFERYGYDGEDFLWSDLKTETWIAPRLTKHRKNAQLAGHKDFYTKECPNWLKTFLKYGESSLMRKELPSVSLHQKTPSSPITCHATGFYPDRADLFWMRDEEELDEVVTKTEILPNQDGTFQMSADLELLFDGQEDWWRHSCVFQLHGDRRAVVTTLDKRAIRSNGHDGFSSTATIILVLVFVVPLKIGIIYARYRCWKAICQGYRRTEI